MRASLVTLLIAFPLPYNAFAAVVSDAEVEKYVSELVKQSGDDKEVQKKLSEAFSVIDKLLANAHNQTKQITEQIKQNDVKNKQIYNDENLKQYIAVAISNVDYSAISKIHISIKLWIETLVEDLSNLNDVWHNSDLADSYKKLSSTSAFDKLSELLSLLYIFDVMLCIGFDDHTIMNIIDKIANVLPNTVKRFLISIMQQLSDILKKPMNESVISEFYSTIYNIINKSCNALKTEYENCLADFAYALRKLDVFIKVMKHESTLPRYSQDMNKASAAIADILLNRMTKLENISKEFRLVCTQTISAAEAILKHIEESKIITTLSTTKADDDRGFFSFWKSKKDAN